MTIRLTVTATGREGAWWLEVTPMITDVDSVASHVEKLLENVEFVFTRPSMLGQTESAFCEMAPYACTVQKGAGTAPVTVTCKMQYARSFKRKSTRVTVELEVVPADDGKTALLLTKDVSLVLKQGATANSRR